MTNDIFLSKKGFKELKKELQSLEKKLVSITQQLHSTDKRQNREARQERGELLFELEAIEQEISEKNTLLARAKLLPAKRNRVKVALGSVVDLIDQHGKRVRYTLVNSIEANPSDGRISVDSPLGKTLIGRSIRDTFEWTTKYTTGQMRLVAIS